MGRGMKPWLAVSGPFSLLWFVSSCLWSWWPIYVNFSRQLDMGLWKWGVEERYSKHAAKFHPELLNHEAGTIYKFGMQFSPSINYFPCLFSFLYCLILSTFLSFYPLIFPYLGLYSFSIFPLICISFPLATLLWITFFPFHIPLLTLNTLHPKEAKISNLVILNLDWM